MVEEEVGVHLEEEVEVEEVLVEEEEVEEVEEDLVDKTGAEVDSVGEEEEEEGSIDNHLDIKFRKIIFNFMFFIKH